MRGSGGGPTGATTNLSSQSQLDLSSITHQSLDKLMSCPDGDVSVVFVWLWDFFLYNMK